MWKGNERKPEQEEDARESEKQGAKDCENEDRGRGKEIEGSMEGSREEGRR